VKTHYIKTRINNSDDLGRVQVSAIRRLSTGKYQAKIHPDSPRKPFNMVDKDWFNFSKRTYNTIINETPCLVCGETLVLEE
jgi:hypothetical protein